MPIVIGGQEKEEAIWKMATFERERIQSLNPNFAMKEAMTQLDKPELSDSDALVDMLDEIINWEFGGIDIWAKYKTDDFYVAKMAHAEFRSATWQGCVAKIYLWLKVYQNVKERLAQIQ